MNKKRNVKQIPDLKKSLTLTQPQEAGRHKVPAEVRAVRWPIRRGSREIIAIGPLCHAVAVIATRLRLAVVALEDFLSTQPDVVCLFLAKYHPECNPLERVWSWSKRYVGDHCDYTWPRLLESVPKSLQLCPLKTIRAYFRRVFRIYSAYDKGMNGELAVYVVRKYKSHRRIPTLWALP